MTGPYSYKDCFVPSLSSVRLELDTTFHGNTVEIEVEMRTIPAKMEMRAGPVIAVAYYGDKELTRSQEAFIQLDPTPNYSEKDRVNFHK